MWSLPSRSWSRIGFSSVTDSKATHPDDCQLGIQGAVKLFQWLPTRNYPARKIIITRTTGPNSRRTWFTASLSSAVGSVASPRGRRRFTTDVEHHFNWCCRRLVRALVLLRRIGDACMGGIHAVTAARLCVLILCLNCALLFLFIL